MKKTLAIVLAVLMAVAALSSFAFIIGSNEVKDDFELLNIYAVDIDLTQAGLRNYEEVVASKDYWTPGKSLAIAVEFRVWNRTLDGHAGAQVGDAYTIAVTSDTADLSFVQYAVTKVASYVSINNQKQLSYVASFPIGTVVYDARSKAGVFDVEIVPQVTQATVDALGAPAAPIQALTSAHVNVLNSTIVGVVTANGYVPTMSYIYDGTGGGYFAGDTSGYTGSYVTNTVSVPVLRYGVDRVEYVDYTLFLSAKHLAPGEDGLGHLSACFALSAADDWVSLYTATDAWPKVGALQIVALADKVDGWFGATIDGATELPVFDAAALTAYYRQTATVAAAGTLGAPAYTAYLDLTSAGYLILRADAMVALAAAAPLPARDVALVRYDVFKYTPELRKADLHYLGSYLTENLLVMGNASAIHFEYNGGVVTLDMTGSYILSSAQITTSVPLAYLPAALNPLELTLGANPWTLVAPANPKLSFGIVAEAKEIAELTKMHADFATGTGQAYGYPIMNNQFLGAAAAATFSTPITNTYLAGQTAAIENVAAIEDTDSPADELDPDDGDVIDDEPVLPAAGDATIAFICAAAAILACAALAFVMKKAR